MNLVQVYYVAAMTGKFRYGDSSLHLASDIRDARHARNSRDFL